MFVNEKRLDFFSIFNPHKKYVKKICSPYFYLFCEYSIINSHFVKGATLCLIWCNLYNFENVKNTHGGVLLLIKLQASKVTLLHGCFSRYLNCTNGTKSQKASLVNISNRVFYSKLISAIVSSVYIRKIVYPAGIYLLKFNNRNTRTRC